MNYQENSPRIEEESILDYLQNMDKDTINILKESLRTSQILKMVDDETKKPLKSNYKNRYQNDIIEEMKDLEEEIEELFESDYKDM